MSAPFLSIHSLERRLAIGNVEPLSFEPGVNVFVGRPNTGKTMWLQTLDFLLGDTGSNPFELSDDEGLPEKYEAAAATLCIGDKTFRVERRWREAGAKGKVFVNDEVMLAKDFQHWLMDKLGIPVVNFPKGNPMSGQTWPELSFRTLLRHIFRQQRFWSGLVDLQTETEQHASLLLFLGLAERIFSDDYGKLVELKLKAMRLRARREQYSETLNDLAVDLLDSEDAALGVNDISVAVARTRLRAQVESLQARRLEVLTEASNASLPASSRSRVTELGHLRAAALEAVTAARQKRQAAEDRLAEVRRYRADLAAEIERMGRVADASELLADLKVTHCPAYDQGIIPYHRPDHCFVCHQHLPEEPEIAGLGEVRLQFEQDRLNAELLEAGELIAVLERDVDKHTEASRDADEKLRTIEVELAPARRAVAAVAQADVSAIDVALGKAAERQRQIDRVAAALELGKSLTEQVQTIEKEIEPLQEKVDEANRSIDFSAAAAKLEAGMNAYLSALNVQRPDTWKHSAVEIDMSRSSTTFRVGRKRWQGALGGTDSLYFLMAYQYGLLSLSPVPGMHYPGLSIIDVPGEFSGEEVKDSENFIVQPFIDLLAQEAFEGAQLIITGASFEGLRGVHVQEQTHVHVAR
jgi:hypothetical protein